VPVLCINARLSDRSYRRLRRFSIFRPAVLGGITRLLPASTQDEARLRELGVAAEKISATGNIKLDLQIELLTEGERVRLRTELGLDEGLVLLGSSTWPGEEAALLKAWRAVRANGIRCSLLLVPRHAERRAEIERALREAQVSFHFRSRGAAAKAVEVAVGDTTGELRKLTQLADLVFVGKSLPPNEGGQTPVEAAALEKPILFGPGMSNFRAIASELVARGAAREVADAAALESAVLALLGDATGREAMAREAGKWRRENAGAVERTLAVIREELAKVGG
jgi:3-deoxy-D-manno-octulosonic-acid transferase